MDTSRIRSHLVFALLSLASPFVAVFAVYLYQNYVYVPDLQPMRPGWEWQGAVYIVQTFLAFFVGSSVGVILSIVSVWKKRKLVSLGTFALVANAIPVLFLLYWWLRGIYV